MLQREGTTCLVPSKCFYTNLKISSRFLKYSVKKTVGFRNSTNKK